MLNCLPLQRADADPSEPVDRLYSLFGGGPDEAAGISRLHRLYEDWTGMIRSLDLDTVLEQLEWYARLYVAENTREAVFVHAGVVAWRDQAIMLPGSSMSGKTTLTAELARRGAAYFSDEYAVLDADGLVHPFAKPLEVRTDGSWQQRPVEPGALGAVQATQALPVGLVVVTSFEDGATWEPQRLSPGHGALELLKHAPAARHRPDEVLGALTRVASRVPVLAGPRGDAAQTARDILRKLEATVAV